jgi:hypothetical protein
LADVNTGKGRKAPAAIDLPARTSSPAEALGDQLKAMFDGVAAQPLPAEIIDLVDQLEGAKARRRSRAH